jgi:hypothetical protein
MRVAHAEQNTTRKRTVRAGAAGQNTTRKRTVRAGAAGAWIEGQNRGYLR